MLETPTITSRTGIGSHRETNHTLKEKTLVRTADAPKFDSLIQLRPAGTPTSAIKAAIALYMKDPSGPVEIERYKFSEIYGYRDSPRASLVLAICEMAGIAC